MPHGEGPLLLPQPDFMAVPQPSALRAAFEQVAGGPPFREGLPPGYHAVSGRRG